MNDLKKSVPEKKECWLTMETLEWIRHTLVGLSLAGRKKKLFNAQ
jgi:hypothetical protein